MKIKTFQFFVTNLQSCDDIDSKLNGFLSEHDAKDIKINDFTSWRNIDGGYDSIIRTYTIIY